MYEYDVLIKGLETIPLRTTKQGAMDLIKSFDHESNFIPLLIEQIDKGTPFKNSFIQVSKVETTRPLLQLAAPAEIYVGKAPKKGTKAVVTKKAPKKGVKTVAAKKKGRTVTKQANIFGRLNTKNLTTERAKKVREFIERWKER